MNITEDFKAMLTIITDQINTLKYLPTHNYSQKPPEPTTVVTSNRRDTLLEVGKFTKNCRTWTLKHDIRSPKFYELFINTELKEDTSLDLNNFYNRINMCLNAATRIR